MQKVTICNWPVSQKCLRCLYGEYFQSKSFNNSGAICFRAVEDFDGTDYDFFRDKTISDDVEGVS